jgi:hypothetical protein
MRKRTIVTTLLAILLGSTFVSSAHAHISLEMGGTHKSRYGDSELKDGVCGRANGKRGTNIYMYEPGQTIMVKLVEYIGHPSYFRWAFDSDGDDGFKDPASITPIDPTRGCPATSLSGDAAARDQCKMDDFYNTPEVLPMMDDLLPHADSPSGMMREFMVKLPDVECDNCTLQVIQVMEDPIHGPYNLMVSGIGDAEDLYHQCIDLVLKRGAGSAGSGASAGATGSAGSSAAGSSAAGSRAAGSSGASGATATSGSSGSAVTAGASAAGASAAGVAGTSASPSAGSTATTPPTSAAAGRPATAPTGTGTSTTGTSTAGSSATTGSTSPAPAASSSSGGCSVSQLGARSDATLASAWLFGALCLVRRRRNRNVSA